MHRVTFWTRDDDEMMELSDDEFADCDDDVAATDDKGINIYQTGRDYFLLNLCRYSLLIPERIHFVCGPFQYRYFMTSI